MVGSVCCQCGATITIHLTIHNYKGDAIPGRWAALVLRNKVDIVLICFTSVGLLEQQVKQNRSLMLMKSSGRVFCCLHPPTGRKQRGEHQASQFDPKNTISPAW